MCRRRSNVPVRILPLLFTLNSLLECLMEFCKVRWLYLLCLPTKSYNVTIQMKPLCLYLHMVLFPNEIWKVAQNLLLAINLAVKGLNFTCLPHYCHFKPSSWCLSPFRLPYYVNVSRPCHLSEFHPKGWFPLSRNFDVCMCLKFKIANKRGNVWKIALKT